jgi:hypothetical protein
MNATMTPRIRFAGAAADVWTDLSARPHRSKKRSDADVSRAAGRRTAVSDEAPLWRVTMAAVEPVRWERVLGIALASSGVAGLVWLVLVCAQFASAWANLAAWVRAAML